MFSEVTQHHETMRMSLHTTSQVFPISHNETGQLDLFRTMELSQEAEEISFVPSAISVPPKPLFRCDNRRSEKTVSFWQFASVVIKEDEESYATNVCHSKWQWNEGRGEKRRVVEGCGECLEKISTYERCGKITPVKDQE